MSTLCCSIICSMRECSLILPTSSCLCSVGASIPRIGGTRQPQCIALLLGGGLQKIDQKAPGFQSGDEWPLVDVEHMCHIVLGHFAPCQPHHIYRFQAQSFA